MNNGGRIFAGGLEALAGEVPPYRRLMSLIHTCFFHYSLFIIHYSFKLVVFAPFTVPKNTDKSILLEKGLKWQAQVKQVFPAHQRPRVLNIIGLLVLDRFSQLTYEEVKTMLNLDLSKSVAVQQVREMARTEGHAEGHAKGHAKGLTEGHTKGRVENTQELILEVLDERFGGITKRLSTQIRQIQQYDVLKMLHRQALRCENLLNFKKQLATAK